MSAENGVPVDKCPKCGSIRLDSGTHKIAFACGTYISVTGLTYTFDACNYIAKTINKRIAQLTADVKYWRDLATEMQEKAVERGNKLAGLRLLLKEVYDRYYSANWDTMDEWIESCLKEEK